MGKAQQRWGKGAGEKGVNQRVTDEKMRGYLGGGRRWFSGFGCGDRMLSRPFLRYRTIEEGLPLGKRIYITSGNCSKTELTCIKKREFLKI